MVFVKEYLDLENSSAHLFPSLEAAMGPTLHVFGS